jgi:hypothetical protein
MPTKLIDLEEFLDFVHELRAARGVAGIDRRGEPRYPLAVVVEFIPLDDFYRDCGPARKAVTRDLSEAGIGFFCESPIDAAFLRVKLPSQGERHAELIVKVLRCERRDFLFDIGGRIVDVEWFAARD